MIELALIAAALAAFFYPQVRALLTRLAALYVQKAIAPHQWIAGAILLVGVMLVLSGGRREDSPTPAPDIRPLSLRGKFTGPTASEDAAIIAGLTGELAEEIEWDGMQSHPFLVTGQNVDELRRRARYLRCRGVSLGERHPEALEVIATYLESVVGDDPGDLTPQSRANWVTAFRDISRAADDASK